MLWSERWKDLGGRRERTCAASLMENMLMWRPARENTESPEDRAQERV
jgi:hypothetical protein